MMENKYGRIDLLIKDRIHWCDERFRLSFFCRLFEFPFFKKLFRKDLPFQDDSLESFSSETSQDRKPRSAKMDVYGRIDLLTKDQIYWCDDHCNFDWFVGDDVKVYSRINDVYFKNKETIFSFPVKFGDCEKFGCSRCRSLVSLEGSPGIVNGNFNCSNCDSLGSLKGSPKKVCENFDCYDCGSLVSLEGSPESTGGYFDCSKCDSLETLKGAPENVGGYFNCSYCKSLGSLEGSSESVGGDFDCLGCESLGSIDELKNTRIDGKIYHEECSKLEKYDLILSDMNAFRTWQKSDLAADEFLEEYSGFVEGQKYGI